MTVIRGDTGTRHRVILPLKTKTVAYPWLWFQPAYFLVPLQPWPHTLPGTWLATMESTRRCCHKKSVKKFTNPSIPTSPFLALDGRMDVGGFAPRIKKRRVAGCVLTLEATNSTSTMRPYYLTNAASGKLQHAQMVNTMVGSLIRLADAMASNGDNVTCEDRFESDVYLVNDVSMTPTSAPTDTSTTLDGQSTGSDSAATHFFGSSVPCLVSFALIVVQVLAPITM